MNETQQAEQVQWSEVTLDSGSIYAFCLGKYNEATLCVNKHKLTADSHEANFMLSQIEIHPLGVSI